MKECTGFDLPDTQLSITEWGHCVHCTAISSLSSALSVLSPFWRRAFASSVLGTQYKIEHENYLIKYSHFKELSQVQPEEGKGSCLVTFSDYDSSITVAWDTLR